MQEKKCNVERIHSVINKGSLFEEEMQCRRRNAMWNCSTNHGYFLFIIFALFIFFEICIGKSLLKLLLFFKVYK